VAVPWGLARTRPASRSSRKCFEMAGRLTRKFDAKSPTEYVRWRKRSRISRRVGSARALKSPTSCRRRDRVVRMVTIYLPLW
jgi:hypothetical protein